MIFIVIVLTFVHLLGKKDDLCMTVPGCTMEVSFFLNLLAGSCLPSNNEAAVEEAADEDIDT